MRWLAWGAESSHWEKCLYEMNCLGYWVISTEKMPEKDDGFERFGKKSHLPEENARMRWLTRATESSQQKKCPYEMIGLGNDYLVNYEFAWTKTPTNNLIGYFPHSLRPWCTHQYRHNPWTPSLLAPHAASRDITPYTLSPCSSCFVERVCRGLLSSGTEDLRKKTVVVWGLVD